MIGQTIAHYQVTDKLGEAGLVLRSHGWGLTRLSQAERVDSTVYPRHWRSL